VPNASAQSVGEQDESCLDGLAVCERHGLPLRAHRYCLRLRLDKSHALWNLRTYRVHQRRVENSVIIARAPLDDDAVARNPISWVERRCARSTGSASPSFAKVRSAIRPAFRSGNRSGKPHSGRPWVPSSAARRRASNDLMEGFAVAALSAKSALRLLGAPDTVG
jgi:hypothetical protein